MNFKQGTSLQWRHNKRDGVWNHRRLDCLLNHLFRRLSTKTSKLYVTDLCEGIPMVIGGFASQRASNAENVSIDDIMWGGAVFLSVTNPAPPLRFLQEIWGISLLKPTIIHTLQTVVTLNLTHWGRDKMDTISHTTLWNAFSWMKMLKFWLKFHWSFFIKAQLTIFQHWFR